MDQALLQEKEQIIRNLKYENEIENLQSTTDLIITKYNSSAQITDQYKTVYIQDSTGNKVSFRQMTSVFKRNGKRYQILLRQSMETSEALITSLIPVEVVLFLILLSGILYLSNIISTTVWSPFYKLLDLLREYDLSKTKIISSISTSIDEFDDLSLSIERMTSKIHSDYVNQKEFHENSSHELQTPLAIIRSKLELLIQSDNMGPEDLLHIQSIFTAVKRLSMLNKSLLLLSKIDNQQYKDIVEIDVKEVLTKIIDNFNDSMLNKSIKLSLLLEDNILIKGNIQLIEILLSNLVSNAIKHNVYGGFISVSLIQGFLTIKNSGNSLNEIDTTKLFKRFVKQSASENSIGLGLSIVKKICDLMDFSISYQSKNLEHSIDLKF